jgi:hypothetical protein
LNAIGEIDLEMLEDYLDDGLSPAQVEHVARRLAEEPELALAMHELRAARVLRAAAWRSLEPTQYQAAGIEQRVVEVVRREAWHRKAWHGAWVSTAAAASVALFAIGWLMRTPAPYSPSQKIPAVAATHARLLKPAVTLTPEPGPYHVALIDRDGRLTPAQKFSKADDARQFARDLLQYEDRRRQAEQGGAMLVSDHF